MGAGPRVAAVSSFDQFPPEVERLPRVGALVDPGRRAHPVAAAGPGRRRTPARRDLLAQLERASIPVYVYRHGSLADITAGMRDLGARIGMAGRGRARRPRQSSAAWRTSARASPGAARPRTLLVIGREPQSLRAINVSGGFGFLHDLLELAGGDNVFGDVKRESMMVATETILARQPEVIIELHYSEQRVARRRGARARRVEAAAGRARRQERPRLPALRRRTGRPGPARGPHRPRLRPRAARRRGSADASTSTARARRRIR